MRTSYDTVIIRERRFRQLKGEEKKNTGYFSYYSFIYELIICILNCFYENYITTFYFLGKIYFCAKSNRKYFRNGFLYGRNKKLDITKLCTGRVVCEGNGHGCTEQTRSKNEISNSQLLLFLI